ncbi:DNA-binding transcriptional response regulator, NtrC family, contains REC, AAA-type ATPase, and a Fis-type DNA-binding domains [Draconibacterium orientale]|uniref:Regulator n=1 Tax=Draconibacterium orientale TaxID=1168034 RepID=X5DZL0_9BACT|nr:sigma-54 dependent transcriptional regulator [Draconibacterium orientale]AHW59736.1 regulator [Draconibacterium orientale]SES76661.1 DNA-binding transcriptional response regulator, NtrC family, contains REC, AAA-type ATPase, and a Fis-type DNA-binding domains [Draconibacterium orientale]
MEVKNIKIFVVEDDEWYRRLLVHNLSMNPDYEIQAFGTGKESLNNLHELPDVVTLDYRLPDMKGLEVLKQIKAINDDIQVILISEQDDIEVVVDLLKHGAYDYIVKSKDIRERLLNTVNNISKEFKLKDEIRSLRQEVKKKYSYENTIVGNSPATQKIYNLIEKATRTNVTVSISGETGTGKELVAKAIHYNSSRARQPFVPVNMAAIPNELIESELFGHEKGAFTGAAARRIGKFEEAHSGTLFLDEIAEMDISLQAKLLRALQEKEIIRIGSNKAVKIDCRIIIATNKNLLEEVKKGNFRQDLYYRFYGLPIDLPPLRDRGNDVIVLAKSFIQQFCKENKLEQKLLSPSASKKLLAYPFPGNVRELKSVIELAVTLADEKEITAEHLLLEDAENIEALLTEELTLREYNLRLVKRMLDKYDNKPKVVADKLDIGIATIYRMLKEDQ